MILKNQTELNDAEFGNSFFFLHGWRNSEVSSK